MIGILALALIAMVWLAIANRPTSATDPSDAPLMGEERPIASSDHVSSAAELIIPEGEPPVGGPHFVQPLVPGIYDEPVNDGNVIHSLEHGMIWLSYNPDLATAEDIEVLTQLAEDHDNDVILSPRPANDMAVAAGSWGRLLTLDSADRDLLEEFIVTNVNRSPEPGLRSGITMN